MTTLTIPTSRTHRLSIEDIGPVEVTVTQRGEGRPFVILHGGAGPQSVGKFADLLAETKPAWVITPTHPGFGGTPRPAALATVRGLAALYVALLDALDLTDVTVVGNSIGGWIAVEMALLGSARISRIVLVDATGIDVPGHPIADVFSLTLDQVFQLSYHNPAPFRIDPSTLPPAAQAIAASNRAALSVYGGTSSYDSGLLPRLSTLDIATLVLWGESDQIVDPDYGRAYANAIPNAQFQLLTETGHVPQIETPPQLLAAVQNFVASNAAWGSDYTVETDVAQEDIWAALRDLYTGTKLSDHGDTIDIHGPFAVGTELSATPLGADFVIRCKIVELVDGKVYAFRSEFNGLFITSRHSLTRLANGGTRITQHAEIAGPRAETVGPQIGPRITEDHPTAMEDLIAAARSRAVGAEK